MNRNPTFLPEQALGDSVEEKLPFIGQKPRGSSRWATFCSTGSERKRENVLIKAAEILPRWHGDTCTNTSTANNNSDNSNSYYCWYTSDNKYDGSGACLSSMTTAVLPTMIIGNLRDERAPRLLGRCEVLYGNRQRGKRGKRSSVHHGKPLGGLPCEGMRVWKMIPQVKNSMPEEARNTKVTD